MKYFLYCRKSSDREDKQELSIESQRRVMTEYAKQRGLKIINTYIEQKSAYKIGRPYFNEMLDRIRNGDADSILTYHLTRLSRNSLDGGAITYLLDENLLKEIRTIDGVYTDTSDSKFAIGISFLMAKKSSDDTSQFVKRDIDSKILKGESPGAAPLGYLNMDKKGTIAGSHYSPEKQKMLMEIGRPLKREEIDPINGPLIRKIFEEASKGTHTLKTLCALSYQLGLRSKHGKKLPLATIWNILLNPYYYGAIRLKGKVYTENIQHDPLISKQLFDRVQQLMKKRVGAGMKRHFFPYTKLFQCGGCGCAITAEIQKGHIYYHCTGRKGDCDQRTWLKSEDLEMQLGNIVQKLVIPPAFLEFVFKNLKKTYASEASIQNTARQSLERRYGLLKSKKDSLFDLKLSPQNKSGALLSDEEYIQQKQLINTEMLELEQQRESYKNQSETWVEDCEKFLHNTQEIGIKYAMGTLEQKKEMMFLLCSKGILKDGSLAFSYREPFASISKLAEATLGRFEPSSSLRVKEKSSEFNLWLPGIFLVRTIVDACSTTTSPIVYRGDFRTWSEEVELLRASE